MTTTTGERWHVRHSRHEGVVVHDENGLIVAYVGSRERHADARLIAAAPQMLDALYVARDTLMMQDRDDSNDTMVAIDEALSAAVKATA